MSVKSHFVRKSFEPSIKSNSSTIKHLYTDSWLLWLQLKDHNFYDQDNVSQVWNFRYSLKDEGAHFRDEGAVPDRSNYLEATTT